MVHEKRVIPFHFMIRVLIQVSIRIVYLEAHFITLDRRDRGQEVIGGWSGEGGIWAGDTIAATLPNVFWFGPRIGCVHPAVGGREEMGGMLDGCRGGGSGRRIAMDGRCVFFCGSCGRRGW